MVNKNIKDSTKNELRIDILTTLSQWLKNQIIFKIYAYIDAFYL